jgi:hypothetical protein
MTLLFYYGFDAAVLGKDVPEVLGPSFRGSYRNDAKRARLSVIEEGHTD